MATCADCHRPCSKRARRCARCERKRRGTGQLSKATIRRQAQRRVSLDGAECTGPGPHGGPLERHHPDHEGQPDLVVVLCRRCHAREDARLGKRGRGSRAGARQPRKPRLPLPELPTHDPARPIVHLVGAAGAGKTELARRWCADSGWVHLEVDALRRGGQSDTAIGGQLARRLRSLDQPVMLESGGLSDAIDSAFRVAVHRFGRPGRYVVCHAESSELARRCLERAKEPLWGSREDLAVWTQQAAWAIADLYPPAVATWVDTSGPVAASYERLRAVLS